MGTSSENRKVYPLVIYGEHMVYQKGKWWEDRKIIGKPWGNRDYPLVKVYKAMENPQFSKGETISSTVIPL